MCTKFEYTCYFEKHSRKRSKIVEKDAAENGISSPPQRHSRRYSEQAKDAKDSFHNAEHAAPEEMIKLRSMEANSGIAFTKFLGMRLDANAEPKLSTFGWNLGTTIRTQPVSTSITDFLSLDQMLAMAELYFENVHPLYGFLDQGWAMRQIVSRYGQSQELVQCPDRMLQGIAVLGARFAPGVSDEVIVPALVESAKLSLEATSTLQSPGLSDVQAWLLRVICLRMCGDMHSCWMASCTTMHLIECMGLHQEESSSMIYSSTNEQKQDPEQHRRTFWVARLFNSWGSFEYGRGRVALRGITCQLPEPREGDFTRDYVSLYSMSCALDPELLDKPGQWEDFLQQLESFDARHECIVLSRANLCLCAYRRLRLANPNVQPDTINRIVSLSLDGLKAARKLATLHKPWWHVSNVPFQVICVLLAIDSRESLSHLAHAMRVLEFVADAFPSPSMREALRTSRFLVRLSKRKKDQDSKILDQVLLRDAEGDPRPENLEQLVARQENGIDAVPAVRPDGLLTTPNGSEDWNLDYLNNSEFDWNFFLSQDIPAFQHLAPDGMM